MPTPRPYRLLIKPFLASLLLLAPGPEAKSSVEQPMLASLRAQRAASDLFGAKRYMDRAHIEEAQNILEEDDDLRGTHLMT
jgi:hypothetical protein